jgi:DNA-binding XRE family transcriptional regulator
MDGLFAPLSEVSPQAGEENNWQKVCYHDSVREKKLAEHLGITPQRLNRWITGRDLPSLRLGLKLQTFLKKQRRRRPRGPKADNTP